MAVGRHWEWRGFGQVPAALRAQVLSLPPYVRAPWRLTDHYLWAPGCTCNEKLREGDLKLKRFLATDGSLESWLEDPAEVFPFPIHPEVVQEMASALGVSLPERAREPLGRDALLAFLARARPPGRVISVEKTRWLRRLDLPSLGAPVLVDLTDITAPETVDSVAVEHADASALHEALAVLQLPRAGLRQLNYLEALGIWAHGGNLMDGSWER